MSDRADKLSTGLNKLCLAISIGAFTICIAIAFGALSISLAIGRLHP